MSPAQSSLIKGAVKSGVASVTALVLGLPYIDAEHFSILNWGGWKHLLSAIGITLVIQEARFWNQWANSSNGGPKS